MAHMSKPLIDVNWSSLRPGGDDVECWIIVGRKTSRKKKKEYVHAHDGLLDGGFVAHFCDCRS